LKAINTQTVAKNRIHTILMFLVIINIIGDVGNVVFWFANASSRAASLNTSYLATTIGIDNALIMGLAFLLVVAIICNIIIWAI
jgi:hypothetical protein